MDPQQLPPITGLETSNILDDRVVFSTSEGTLEVSFWDEDIVRLRLGDEQVNSYPIIVGTPAGKKNFILKRGWSSYHSLWRGRGAPCPGSRSERC